MSCIEQRLSVGKSVASSDSDGVVDMEKSTLLPRCGDEAVDGWKFSIQFGMPRELTILPRRTSNLGLMGDGLDVARGRLGPPR